jgi:hypothetical protein
MMKSNRNSSKRRPERQSQIRAKTAFGKIGTATMYAPVDPQRFMAMTQVFNEGAMVPLKPHQGAGYHLTDIPMNRAMMAVFGACMESGAADAETEATMTRLMLMGQVVEARHLFGKYIRSGADGRTTDLHGALLKAVAVARIDLHGEHARFDLDDVLLHAQRFEASDAASK